MINFSEQTNRVQTTCTLETGHNLVDCWGCGDDADQLGGGRLNDCQAESSGDGWGDGANYGSGDGSGYDLMFR
jgi:hypothetical protein